jgi:cathepsin L
MRILYKFLTLCLFVISFCEAERIGFNSELLEEWELWKTQHRKSYAHRVEELDRHLVWASNRKYIEEHNANADLLGYTLAMNHFGDLVRYGNRT